VKKSIKTILGSILLLTIIFSFKGEDWGFFGHKKINRMAVFTLPQEMLPLYKKYIKYLEIHSVDPDKRRYATKHEAVRHYIDLDQWGSYPFENVPKDFNETLSKYSSIYVINGKDSTEIKIRIDDSKIKNIHLITEADTIASVSTKKHTTYFSKYVFPNYYEDECLVNIDTFNKFYNTKLLGKQIKIVDHFSEHGILPYNLFWQMNRLTKAFEENNLEKILRLSAEIGHYVGDAHVPLHTTKNYNGQLTDQVGIHAFWESRLPELFANDEYDFFVGKAEYIINPRDYFWDIVLESNSYLNDVLNIEKELSKSFPSDKQYCYDERLGMSVRIQCKEYSKAYHEAMKGMVEDRMTKAIKSIGSVWYTCWVNGGQPNLKDLVKNYKDFKPIEEDIIIDPKIKTRDHENE
jgi:hypothetical protein